MAEKKTGIFLNLKENVSDALKKVGKAAKEARRELKGTGKETASVFNAAFMALTAVNQGLEVAGKAMSLYNAAVTSNIETALKFKHLNDDSAKTFKNLSREAELVKARIGDALIPVVKGFSEAMTEGYRSVSRLVTENQKLIGSTLIDWIGGTAKMLTTVLARAIDFVGKAFLGWKIIISALQAAFSSYYAFVLRGLEQFLGKIASVLNAFGADGLAKTIEESKKTVGEWSDVFQDTADDSVKDIEKTSAQIDKLEKTIKKVEGAVKKSIGEGMVKAQKEVQKATTGTNKTLEEQLARINRLNDAIDKMTQKRLAAIDAEANRFERDARAWDAQQQQALKAEGGTSDAGGALLGGLGGFGDIAAGFGAGGIGGAAGAGLAALIESSEELQAIFEDVGAIFKDIVSAVDPLFAAIKPIVRAINTVVGSVLGALAPVFKSLADILHPLAVIINPIVNILINMNPLMLLLKLAIGELQPVLEILSTVLSRVAGFVLDIAQGISNVWNGIVEAIADVLRKIGRVKVFGKKPLGALEDWGDDLQREASISTTAIQRARHELDRGWELASEGLDEGADTIKKTVEKMGRELINVPAILKVALHEFRAATPESSMGSFSQDSAASAAKQRTIANMPGRGAGLHAETVNVYQATNTEELVEQADKEARRQSFIKEGSLAMARAGIAFG